MEKVIVVKIQNVYGAQKVYPVNEQAKLFAAISGTKTLSNATICYAAKLGYVIKQEEAYSLEEVVA